MGVSRVTTLIWKNDWATNSLLKINSMPCATLAPVLLSLKSCFLWSFVTVFFSIKIRYFFSINIAIWASAVCDLFPWSRFLVDPMQSICIYCTAEHLSVAQPRRWRPHSTSRYDRDVGGSGNRETECDNSATFLSLRTYILYLQKWFKQSEDLRNGNFIPGISSKVTCKEPV